MANTNHIPPTIRLDGNVNHLIITVQKMKPQVFVLYVIISHRPKEIQSDQNLGICEFKVLQKIPRILRTKIRVKV